MWRLQEQLVPVVLVSVPGVQAYSVSVTVSFGLSGGLEFCHKEERCPVLF